MNFELYKPRGTAKIRYINGKDPLAGEIMLKL